MSKEIIHDKLVRDKILEIIDSAGKTSKFHIADDAEYRDRLLEKIQEELKEFNETPCEEEAADILEVLYSLFALYQFDRDRIEEIRQEKVKKRGGFEKRIILEKVIEDFE